MSLPKNLLYTKTHEWVEIIKDGVHVNPMTVKLPAISNLGKADKKKFLEYRKTLDQGIGHLQRHPSMFIQL
jgi:glycine cleavage system H lipoate-binding protein